MVTSARLAVACVNGMRTLQVAVVHLLQLQSALLLHLLDTAVELALLLISHHLCTPARSLREDIRMQGLHSSKWRSLA